jgi:O-antigen/teichoic acid export membrane protein
MTTTTTQAPAKTDFKVLYLHCAHYLAGRTGIMMLGLVSFPIFARIFTVAEYGIMTLAFKLAGVATVFAKMGLQQSVVRFYEENAGTGDRHRATTFYSTLIIGALGTAVAVTAVFLLGIWGTPEAWVSQTLKAVFYLAAGIIAVRAVQSVVMGFLRSEGRTKMFNAVDIANKGGTVALACVVLFYIDRSVRGFIAATTIVEGLAVVAVVVFFMRRGLLDMRRFDAPLFWAAFAFSVPLVGSEVAAMVLDSADRFLVQNYLGAQAVGYYSAAYNIAAYLQDSLMIPMNLAIAPLYMKLWTNEGRERTQAFLGQCLEMFVAVAAVITAAAWVTSKDIITILGSKKYEAAHELVPVLVLGLLVFGMHNFFNAGLLIYKRTRTLMKLILISCAVKIGLNFALLPLLGLRGTAAATVVSHAVLSASVAWASFRVLPLPISLVNWSKYAAAAVVSFWSASYLHLDYALASFILKAGVTVVVYGAVVILIHRPARELLKKLVARMRYGALAAAATPEGL